MFSYVKWCAVAVEQKRNKIFEAGCGARNDREEMPQKKILSKMCKSW